MGTQCPTYTKLQYERLILTQDLASVSGPDMLQILFVIFCTFIVRSC